MKMTDKIRRLLAKGLNVSEIAKKLKINPSRVHTVKWLDKKKKKTQTVQVERSHDPKVVEAEQDYLKTVKRAMDVIQKKPYMKAAFEKPDFVNRPPHYRDGGIDFLDYAEAKGLTENAYLFNVVKYVSRAGKKVGANPVEDLKKAQFYLSREIAIRERA